MVCGYVYAFKGWESFQVGVSQNYELYVMGDPLAHNSGTYHQVLAYTFKGNFLPFLGGSISNTYRLQLIEFHTHAPFNKKTTTGTPTTTLYIYNVIIIPAGAWDPDSIY